MIEAINRDEIDETIRDEVEDLSEEDLQRWMRDLGVSYRIVYGISQLIL